MYHAKVFHYFESGTQASDMSHFHKKKHRKTVQLSLFKGTKYAMI